MKAIHLIRSKYKQKTIVESIVKNIENIEAILCGNESISKSFFKDRIEVLLPDDKIEKKPRLEKNSHYITEKSKQLLLI